MHGRWVTRADEYVAAVERYEREVGNIVFAAPQDWMCEPAMLARTGLTVREHQEHTVANYLELRGRGPFIPVLQGWTIADYERCVALYANAGVNLYDEPLVGLGTVCRRENAAEIGSLVRALQPLRLHGFGVKKRGLERYGHLLTSADSMAWSFRTPAPIDSPAATTAALAPTADASRPAGATRSARCSIVRPFSIPRRCSRRPHSLKASTTHDDTRTRD